MRRKILQRQGQEVLEKRDSEQNLETRHSIVKLRLIKIRSMENGSIMKSFLLYIGLEPKKRVVDELVLECAETARYSPTGTRKRS